MFRAPNSIAAHPGVKEVDDAVEGGAPDYKYDVLLKEGWMFKNGRMAGCRTAFFKNVKEFNAAEPIIKEN